MSKPIAVGDLVQVVLPLGCCYPSEAIGKIFTVEMILTTKLYCRQCKHDHGIQEIANGSQPYIPTWRLKRIPPLEELEGQRTQEQLKETA